jgi:hypothetical protein
MSDQLADVCEAIIADALEKLAKLLTDCADRGGDYELGYLQGRFDAARQVYWQLTNELDG